MNLKIVKRKAKNPLVELVSVAVNWNARSLRPPGAPGPRTLAHAPVAKQPPMLSKTVVDIGCAPLIDEAKALLTRAGVPLPSPRARGRR